MVNSLNVTTSSNNQSHHNTTTLPFYFSFIGTHSHLDSSSQLPDLDMDEDLRVLIAVRYVQDWCGPLMLVLYNMFMSNTVAAAVSLLALLVYMAFIILNWWISIWKSSPAWSKLDYFALGVPLMQFYFCWCCFHF